MSTVKILAYKEPHLCNALLIIASGFIECITYLLCFNIFASFMTGTIIVGVVDFATRSNLDWVTLLRILAVVIAFIGGFISLLFIRYKLYKKVRKEAVFTQMLTLQSILLVLLTVIMIFFMRFNLNREAISSITVIVLSFNMGFHHHHLGIKYKGMAYRTHFMTFNTWNMFNLIVKYRELPKAKRKESEGQDLIKKARFLLLVLLLFFGGVFACAELINFFSFFTIIIPTLLFVLAAYLSRGKEV